MREKDIVLTQITQSDGQIKLRPVLILRKMPTFDDFLVCGISTQLHQEIKDFDVILDVDTQNNLKAKSLIRLSFLAVAPSKQLLKTIGSIDTTLHKLMLNRLSTYLIN